MTRGRLVAHGCIKITTAVPKDRKPIPVPTGVLVKGLIGIEGVLQRKPVKAREQMKVVKQIAFRDFSAVSIGIQGEQIVWRDEANARERLPDVFYGTTGLNQIDDREPQSPETVENPLDRLFDVWRHTVQSNVWIGDRHGLDCYLIGGPSAPARTGTSYW